MSVPRNPPFLRLAGTAAEWRQRHAAAAAWLATAAPSASIRTGTTTPDSAEARATSVAVLTATSPVRTTIPKSTTPGHRQQQQPPPVRPVMREQNFKFAFLGKFLQSNRNIRDHYYYNHLFLQNLDYFFEIFGEIFFGLNNFAFTDA